MLNHRIKNDREKKLCVILVLPPYADDHPLEEDHCRKLALNDLTAGLNSIPANSSAWPYMTSGTLPEFRADLHPCESSDV